jgi:hypothetical protein
VAGERDPQVLAQHRDWRCKHDTATLVRAVNIMGRENVIAGTDCGYGNRVYPDIACAKMKAMAEGAAWPPGNSGPAPANWGSQGERQPPCDHLR